VYHRCRKYFANYLRTISSNGRSLEEIDQRTVAVQIGTGKQKRVFCGLARFTADSEFGGLLRIKCVDVVGAFEFLIREEEWSGTVEPDAKFGCDYLIRLASSS
jgi:hypothetical protein